MKKLILNLLKHQDIVSFDPNYKLEVKPDTYSPIYINIKRTSYYCDLREEITSTIINIIKKWNIDLICGVEHGGLYYSSILAQKLMIPVVFLRTTYKKYADIGHIVGGDIDPQNKVVLCLDDVIATGQTLKKIEKIFYQKFQNTIDLRFLSIFSYKSNNQLNYYFKYPVSSIFYIKELLNIAEQNNILKRNEKKIISKYLLTI